MSVYGSFGIFAADDGHYQPPILYQRSHVLPARHDARGGSIDLGQIPAFITRGASDDGPDDGRVWPYLRFSLDAGQTDEDTVVLDRAQVQALRDELSRWLERVDSQAEHR